MNPGDVVFFRDLRGVQAIEAMDEPGQPYLFWRQESLSLARCQVEGTRCAVPPGSPTRTFRSDERVRIFAKARVTTEQPNPYSVLNQHEAGQPLLIQRHACRSAQAKREFFRVNAMLIAPLLASLVDQAGVQPLNHELYVFRLPASRVLAAGTICDTFSVRVSDGWAYVGSAELSERK